MARTQKNTEDATTRTIERHVVAWMKEAGLPGARVKAFRVQPHGFIRLRIIHDRFHGKSLVERDEMTRGMLENLPGEINDDITMVLAISPRELKWHPVNLEFESPSPSNL
jgi:stress-induced morphogen